MIGTQPRYTRDVLEIKRDARNKMIKTYLVNVKKIAKQLKIPEVYIIKYMSVKKSTRCDLVNHTLSGSYTVNELEDLLESLIREIVLCQSCQTPELNIHVPPPTFRKTSNLSIRYVCRGCRTSGTFTKLPVQLEKLMRAHPPPIIDFKTSTERKREAQDTQYALMTLDETAPLVIDDDQIEWYADTSAEAVESRRQAEMRNSKLLLDLVKTDVPPESKVEATANVSAVVTCNDYSYEYEDYSDSESLDIDAI